MSFLSDSMLKVATQFGIAVCCVFVVYLLFLEGTGKWYEAKRASTPEDPRPDNEDYAYQIFLVVVACVVAFFGYIVANLAVISVGIIGGVRGHLA